MVPVIAAVFVRCTDSDRINMVYFALQDDCSTVWVTYYEEHGDGIRLQLLPASGMSIRVTLYEENQTRCVMYDMTQAMDIYPHTLSLYKYDEAFSVHVNNKLIQTQTLSHCEEHKFFVKIERLDADHRLLLVHLDSPQFFRSPHAP